MEIVKVSSRGQIVIPLEIRKKYNIQKYSKLVLFDYKDKLVLVKEEKMDKFEKSLKVGYNESKE